MEKNFFSTITKIAENLELKYYWVVFLKYLKPIFFISFLFTLLVLLISLNLEKKYRSVATIVIEADESKKIVNIEEVYSLDNQESRINNQIAILNSDDVLDYIVNDKESFVEFAELFKGLKPSFIKRLFVKDSDISKEGLKNYLKSNFSVTNIPRSDVLELSFISPSPKISKLALKNIISSYQRYEIDSKIVITSYANEKITSRLEELTKQMEIAEANLSKYKEENGLVDTGDVKELKIKQIETISQNILDLEKQISQYEGDLLAIKMSKGDVNQLTSIKDLMIRPEIKNIYDSLLASRNNLESLRLIYTDQHPKVKKAIDTIQSYERQLVQIIDQNIEKKTFELTNLKNSIDINKNSISRATKELRELEEKESGMLKFSREVASSRKLYETFLQRVKETNEAQNLQVSKMKVIETPTLAKSPFFPKPNQNFLLAFIISFVGFYSLIYYKEINSSVISSPETIEKIGINQIGILPKIGELKKGYHILQMFVEDPDSNFSESIRSIRATIESKFNKNSSYLITSSNPAEGKTTFAFNLALSLEKSNKVLFIEADIRRPSVLNGFYKFDKVIPGLGEIISGDTELRDCILKVPGTELSIITSGEKRFDMSDIVNKEQIKKFFDLLKMEYDYLIVDSPPVQPVSDTLILAQASDYNLFIIRSETSKNAAFISSMKKMQNVNANISGVVLNDLDTSKDSYYSYYYNYSSNYYSKS